MANTVEFEKELKQIISQKNVTGAIVLDEYGNILKSTLDKKITRLYADYYYDLIWYLQRNLRNYHHLFEELTFIHIGTKTHEILVTLNDNLIFIVIQKSIDVKYVQ